MMILGTSIRRSTESISRTGNPRTFSVDRSSVGVFSCVTLFATYAALAQQTAPNQDVLQEIIVTAEKRTTTLQETPISITAVAGDELVRLGYANITSVVAEFPGVSFQSVGPGRTNYNIRGLSNTGGSSPTVGFYLDDAPVTPPTSAIVASLHSEISPDLYDLERVEVLRGPQGTLYGAGSEGGTIRLLTNQPKLDRFEATAETSLSDTERGQGPNYGVNAMFNVPLVDNQLALRIVGTDTYEEGYIDRIVVSPFPQYTDNFTQRGNVAAGPVLRDYRDVNGARTEALRATLLWQPVGDLKITPSIFIQRIGQGGQNTIDLPPGNFAHYQAGDIPEEYHETFDLYALDIKYSLGSSIALESTTSELNIHSFNQEDVSEQWYGTFLPDGAPFLTSGSGWENHEEHQFNEEIRLSSAGDSRLQWLAGAFYDDFKDSITFAETSPGLIPYDGSSNAFTDEEPDHLKQEALFGEATYAVLPTLKVTAGLRYFHYGYTFVQNYSGLATAPPYVSSGTTSASGTTPKVGLTYLPNENLTLFANAAKGFRPGGANLPIPPSFCNTDLATLGVQTFRPDSVWSYELGEKAKVLNGSAAIRASVYYIDWKDIQQNVPLACGFGYTANAGAATSKGGELEFDALITHELTLHESVGYTKAEITSSSIPALAVGSPLADVPEVTANSSVEYKKALSNGWDLSGRMDYQYIGPEFDPSAQPYPDKNRGGYGLVNMRVGAEAHTLSAYLYADNLLNKLAYVGFDRSESQNTVQYARVVPTRPRTIGIDFQYRY